MLRPEYRLPEFHQVEVIVRRLQVRHTLVLGPLLFLLRGVLSVLCPPLSPPSFLGHSYVRDN